MNHAGEITPLVAHGAAACRAGDDDRAGAHRASRLDRRQSPTPRPKSSPGSNRRRRRPQSRRAAVRAARRRGARARRAGRDLRRRRAPATRSLSRSAAVDGGSRVRARVFGRELDFVLGAPGCTWRENALGVLLACDALGADVAGAAAALAEFAPQQGARRALRRCTSAERPVHRHRRKLQRQSRLDARRAGAARRRRAGRRRAAHRGDRRHARTRSRRRGACTRRSPRSSARNRVDLLFGAGPLTRALYDAAPRGDARRLGRAVERHSAPDSPTRCAAATSSWSRVRTAAAWGRSWRRLREHFSSAEARR